ncbi:MAG: HAMP domain-containing protein [Candidatus Omnitrophota bacterium]|jgi:HAMP domain-containing protein
MQNNNINNQTAKKIQIKGLPLGLTLKSFFTPFILIASASIILVYLMTTISGYMQMQSVLETAGKQRILNQQFMKEILMSSKGIPTAHESTAKQITTSIDLLKRNTVATNTSLKAKSDIQQIQNELSKQKTIFNSLSEASNTYLRSFDTKDQKSKVFEELHLHSLELQGAVNTTVATYDQHLQSGIPWWDVDAIAVEIAERQKMLVQQHIKEVLFVASGIPNDYQSTRIKLHETLKLLTGGGEMSLSEGQKIVIPAPKTDLLKETLSQQLIKLKQFIATSNQYLMLTNASVDQQLKVQQLLTLNESMHDSSTKTFVIYQNYLANRVSVASRNCVLAGLLLVIFGLLLTWQFASHVLLKPLSKIKAALRRLGEGDTSVQINTVSRDEIGSVALQLNRSASKLHDKILSMNRWMEDGDYSHLKVASQHDKMGGAIRQWANGFKDKLSHVARTVSHSPEGFTNNDASEPALFINLKEPQPLGLRTHPLIEDLTDGEIVGVAPDLNTFNENDMFGQLLNRANELKTQQRQLLAVNQELKEETISLNDSKHRLRSAEDSLRNRNEELLRDNYEKDEVFENQKRIISEMSAKLQDQTDALRRSEVRLNAQSTELTTINSALMVHATEHSQHVQILEKTMKEKAIAVQQAQSRINELRSQITDYQAEKDALQTSLTDVKDGLGAKDHELAEFQKMLESKEADLNKQNGEFDERGSLDKNRLDTLKLIAEKDRVSRAALISMTSKYESLIKNYDSLKVESNQVLFEKNTELSNLQVEFTNTKQNHAVLDANLRRDHELKLSRLQDNHRQALDQLVQSKSLDESQARGHYEHQIQTLKYEQENQSTLIKNEYESRISKLESAKESEATLVKNEYESRISKLESAKESEATLVKNEYESRISKLESAKESEATLVKNEYESRLAQLNNSRSNDINLLKSDYETHIKNIKEVQDAETSVLSDKFQKEISDLKSSNASTANSLTLDYDSQIAELKADIADADSLREDQIASLTLDYDSQIAELKADIADADSLREDQIASLTLDYDSQIEKLRTDIDNADSVYDDQINSLTTELNAQIDQLKIDYTDQINGLNNSHEANVKQLKASMADAESIHKDQINELATDYTSQMEKIELGHLNQIQELTSSYDSRINDLDVAQLKEIDALTEHFEHQITTAGSQVSSMKTTLDNLKSDQVFQIQQLAETHTSEISRVESQFAQDLETLKSVNENENSRIHGDYTMELDRLKAFQGNYQAESMRIRQELECQIVVLRDAKAKQHEMISTKEAELENFRTAEITFLESAAQINGLQSDLSAALLANSENKTAKEDNHQKYLNASESIAQLEQELISSREVHEIWSNRLLQAESKLETAHITIASKTQELLHIEAQFKEEGVKTSLIRYTAQEEAKEAFRQIELKELEITSLNKKIDFTRDALQVKESDLLEKIKALDYSSQRIDALQQDAQNYQIEITKNAAQLQPLEASRAKLEDALQVKESDLLEKIKALDYSSQRIDALQQDAQNYQIEITKNAAQLQPLEARLAKLENDLEACKSISIKKQELLKVAEERLSSTRQALKASIDELDEKSF